MGMINTTDDAGFTPNQAYMYNSMISDFSNDFANKAMYERGIRFGQALYNYFYGTVFNDPFPELFYCDDNHKAQELFNEVFVVYLKNEVD